MPQLEFIIMLIQIYSCSVFKPLVMVLLQPEILMQSNNHFY